MSVYYAVAIDSGATRVTKRGGTTMGASEDRRSLKASTGPKAKERHEGRLSGKAEGSQDKARSDLRRHMEAVVDWHEKTPLLTTFLKSGISDKKEIEEDQPVGLNIANTGGDMEFELKKYARKGRSLRKDFERPRPDLPANAQENRTRKPITATLPPDLISEINDRCRALGVDRTTFIEAAIRAALKPT